MTQRLKTHDLEGWMTTSPTAPKETGHYTWPHTKQRGRTKCLRGGIKIKDFAFRLDCSPMYPVNWWKKPGLLLISLSLLSLGFALNQPCYLQIYLIIVRCCFLSQLTVIFGMINYYDSIMKFWVITSFTDKNKPSTRQLHVLDDEITFVIQLDEDWKNFRLEG